MALLGSNHAYYTLSNNATLYFRTTIVRSYWSENHYWYSVDVVFPLQLNQQVSYHLLSPTVEAVAYD